MALERDRTGKKPEEVEKDEEQEKEKPGEEEPSVQDLKLEQGVIPIRFETLFRSITTRQQVEKAIHEDRDRFRKLFDKAAIGIARVSLKDGTWIEINDAFCDMLGHQRDTLLNTPWMQLTHPDDLDDELVQFQKMARGDIENFALDKRFKHKDGRYFWVRKTFYLVRDDRERPFYGISLVENIDDRKRAEEELRRSEEMLKATQAIAHLGSWVLDITENRLIWSDEVYRIFGLKPREFTATYEAFLDSVHPEDRKRVDDAYMGSVRENMECYDIEHRVIRKDTGEIRIVHEKCSHTRDRSGNVIRSVGMVHDITDLKRYEEKLESLAQFPDENPDPVLRVDRNGIVLYANRNAGPILRMWNCEVGGMIQGNYLDHVKEIGRSDQTVRHEHELDQRFYSIDLVPIPGKDYINVYAKDITELECLRGSNRS